MSVHIALLGATGRMGQQIAALLHNHKTASLSGISAGDQHPQLGQTLAAASDLKLASVDRACRHANVVVDFSLPQAVGEHLALCKALDLPYVCGVTGLDDGLMQQLQDAGQSIAVFWAPNMSIGVNLCLASAAQIAASLGTDFAVNILDIHHVGKLDSPSGTALEFGRVITGAAASDPVIDYESIREGQHPGEHHVVFRCADEIIELRHQAGSRRQFAEGAVKAAGWLIDQPPGFYNMRNLLNITQLHRHPRST